MVSVIIPCFNGFRYMERCLSALERQTHRDFEVVIVDDGSTDGSFEALERYKNSSPLNMKIIQNKTNRGPGKSREIGIRNSGGRQVAFCDCDDWYEEGFIEKMTELAEKENADLVLCDSYRVKGNIKKPTGATGKILESRSREEILARAPMSLCRTLIKRELVERVKFLDLYYGEDGVVLLQLIAGAKKIMATEEALYNYLVRETSASSRPSKRACLDGIEGYRYLRGALHEQYPEACEFIGIKNIIYAATLGAFKSGVPLHEIKKMAEDFSKDYPRYINNRFMADLGRAKKIYIHCINRRNYVFCRLLASIHRFCV